MTADLPLTASESRRATDDGSSTAPDRVASLRAAAADRAVPLAILAAMLLVGAVFMFWWLPVVRHVQGWFTPGDVWGVWRAAHYVGWGYLGGVYAPGNGVIAFPGMSVVLAPVAVLSGHLHLTESAAPVFLPRPGAALLLMPVELILAGTSVFAADAFAAFLGADRRRRALVCLMTAVLAWPAAAVWGHAEDALAMTFVLYAIMAFERQRWTRCAWLLGCGIAVQPLALLLLPLFIGASPAGRRLLLAVRSTALSAFLVGVALAGNPSGTLHELIDQPTPPAVNHATPWASLSPRIAGVGRQTIKTVVGTGGRLHPRLSLVTIHRATPEVVSGGPGRILGTLVAIALGVLVWRRRPTARGWMWLVALVLASRCFFEPVMTPYYLAPPLILGVALVSGTSARRLVAASAVAAETSIFAYHFLNPWVWWMVVVIGLAGVLALAWPGQLLVAAGPDRTGGSPVDDAPGSGEPEASGEPAGTQESAPDVGDLVPA